MKKYGILLAAGALGTILSCAALPSRAQSSDQGTSGSTQLERVEITGSYIRRTDTETEAPVQQLTNDDIRRSGFTSLAEVLSNVTANGQGTLSQGFSGAFAQGACGLALRGMTVGSTLILLDGHRMAPYPLADDGQRSFVDICQLPLDAVDHVDILKDGASALYGSDAIAGVVNVVLKKSYKGATISAENGWTQRGGGETSHLTGTFGFGDLAQDGINAFFTVEYRHQAEIQTIQRPYLSNLNYSAQGGQNLTPGGNNQAFGGNLPLSPTGYFVNPAASPTANPFTGYGWLPGCTAAKATANQCSFLPTWLDIVPQTQNANVLARVTKKLWGDWELSATASLFESTVLIRGAPFSTGTSGISGASFAPGPGGLTTASIYSTPGPFQAPIPASVASQLGLATGTLVPVNVMTNDLGGQNTFIRNDTYRLVTEAKGTALGWDVDAYWGWTTDNMNITQNGFPIFSALYNDLANGSYVPGQVNSPGLLATIAPSLVSKDSDELWFTGAHASRDLFTLPGGPLAVAVGADFFYRSLNSVPAKASTLAEQAPDFAYALGSQSDWSVFTEVSAPIIKEFSIDTAARYDKYNTYSPGELTPKFGFKLTPVPEVALRGTISRGFRAPNPVESQGSAAGGYFGNFADPTLCPHSATPTAVGNYPNQCIIPEVFLTVNNPALKPEKSLSKTLGIILEPIKGLSASVDYFDIKLTGMIYPASEDSAFSPTFVRSPTPQPQPYNSPTGVITQTPPIGNFLYLGVPYININDTEVRGLDFGLRDTWKLGELGKVKGDILWSHTLHYWFDQPGLVNARTDVAGTHGPNEISGDTGNPRNRAQLGLTWERPTWETTLTMNYISGISVTDPSGINGNNPDGQNTCLASLNSATEYGGTAFFPAGTTPPAGACHVASFTYFDLYGNWHVDHHWSIHGSIENLFDRQAPADLQTYAAPNYNPSLHMPGAIGRFFTIGARYEF